MNPDHKRGKKGQKDREKWRESKPETETES